MPDFGRWTSNGGDPSLNDVNRVDRFFDALGTGETAYSTDHAEAELAFLLADWRDDVRSAPVTVPITTRDAVEALNAGLGTRRRGRGSLVLVGSAAAAVLCIGGFGAAVFSAGPGDAFYGIRTALFGQQAARDENVVLTAQAEMLQVQQLIDDGQWEQAQDKLVALSTTVQSVETPEQKQQLVEQFNQLTVKVVEQDPAATLPPDAPLPTFTDSPLTLLPIPTFQITDTSTTTTSETTTSTTSGTSETSTTSTTTETSPTPGPEIMVTPPTSGSEGSESPTSPTTPPSSTTTTTTTTTATSATGAPPSPTRPPTTTTRVEVTSVTSVPSSAPQLPPSTVSVAPQSPAVQPTVAPSAVAPPSVEAPVEEPTASVTTAPKPVEREPSEAPVTTTVAPAG